MSTVRLVDEATASPRVRAVFEDIKATKKTERVSNVWRALATNSGGSPTTLDMKYSMASPRRPASTSSR